MTAADGARAPDDYDEFGLLHENADECGLTLDPDLVLERGFLEVEPGRRLSYIRWGTAEPELVLLHGGGQNAHTWDSVALALGRPAIAVDLPGHGHSFRRADRDYGPWRNAAALEVALPRLAPEGAVVVGMSLGGVTAIHLAAKRPDLCRRAVVVDVTPQVNAPGRSMTTQERGSVALIAGPPEYESLEEMVDAAVALNPSRPASAVRRGVRHNALRDADGRWRWRYDLFGPLPEGTTRDLWDFTPLWDDVSSIRVPAMLVRGGLSRFVLDEDAAEMRRRLPDLRVEVVDGAGHAVQSDRPLELARLIEDFAFAGT
ncbi:MAG: alpha/beta hydrolase [Acidimicrobiia bacterium]|nr:alpha/beta hydrolase [Acidimicrobiia bacterium]